MSNEALGIPAFNPDLTNVTASLRVFPKGTYQFVVGDPKPFFKKATEKVGAKFGLRWTNKISAVIEDGDPDSVGQKSIQSGYMHNEDSMGFTKQFVMACLGFRAKEEQDFNDAMRAGEADWGLDYENLAVNENSVWKQTGGCSVLAELDITLGEPRTPGEEPMEFQRFTWIPMKALAEAAA